MGIHQGTGIWRKKVDGKVHYFGKVADDPKGTAALEEWLRVKDDLLARREPQPKESDALTVADLCNLFLAHHEKRRDGGEISPRTFQTYYATCANVCDALSKSRAVAGLVPDDFRKLRQKLAKQRKAVALRNEMTRVRSNFKFAVDDALILAPVKFGKGFDTPSKEVIDRAREAHRMAFGDKMFEADELRLILAHLDGEEVPTGTNEKTGEPIKVKGHRNPALKAMILLGINSGYGNTDVSSLPTRAVNLDSGWVAFPRPKTAVRRKCWLWPETIAAIREWLEDRPKAKDPTDAGLLFLTCRGAPWVKLNKSGSPSDAVGQEFVKVLRKLDLKRAGVSFYALRHGFETIGGETTDQVAVDAVMGHKTPGMAATYRERIGDDRLRRVSEHVRQWLFADTTDGTTGPQGTTTDSSAPDDSMTNEADGDAPTLKLFAGENKNG